MNPASRVLLPVLLLSGCAGIADNRTMTPLHTVAVDESTATLDLVQGPEGLAPEEQRRLADWLAALDAGYGARIAVAGSLARSRSQVEQEAARRDLPVAEGQAPADLPPGTLRVTVTRAYATVAGCPDWSAHSDANFANALSPNFGCATNANLAAMIADPRHLTHGAADTGLGSAATATRAIASYRAKPPTGAGDLKQDGTKGN